MRTLKFSFAALLFLIATACSHGTKSSDETSDSTSSKAADSSSSAAMTTTQKTAKADISQANNSGVSGTVMFTDLGNQTVKIDVNLHGLKPGLHALHLHQDGDCSAMDAMSAGGHWNPTNKKHGHRGVSAEWHKGDVDNITADASGNATYTADVQGWTIGGPDSTNVVGHAVIVHADADDFVSQPAGNAGARVACGVITAM